MPRGRKKKNKRRNASTLVVRGPTVIPDQMFTKLKYAQQFTLTEPNGIFQKQIFRGNSIFDPDQTGTGGQPMGRDQYANLYSRYQVMGSKITVKALPRDKTQGSAYTLNLLPVDNTNTIAGNLEAQETSYAKSAFCSLVTDRPQEMSSYMSTKAKFGYKDILQEDDLSALQGTNPVEQWYWLITCTNAISANMVVDFNVEIEYYVRFFDRIDLSRS